MFLFYNYSFQISETSGFVWFILLALNTFKVAASESISHLEVLDKRWYFCSVWHEFNSACCKT